MNVVTHRGLDFSKSGYFAESSSEAFADQLGRGFGLEFDVQMTKDNKLAISHDSDLKRISHGQQTAQIRDLNLSEVVSLNFSGCHLISLDALLDLIARTQAAGAISALHVKHGSQSQAALDALSSYLTEADPEKFIIFDLKPDSAEYLKSRHPKLHLAPSVAHPYDIERYNQCVGGTLMTVESAIARKELFDWVWLDEWDRADKGGGSKKLYTAEVFGQLRDHGFRIGLVTPELHASSPGLLGSEKHSDAADKGTLFGRIKEIVALKPDIICTDYPDEVRTMI